jgi:hypothetical protein
LPLKFLTALFLATGLWFAVDSGSAEEPTVSFEISPDGPQLLPGMPATLTLSLKTASQGAAQRWVTVRLEAPPGVFFSTDFPIVEGSKLLEARLPIIDGKAKWLQVLPIRGEYRLRAHFVGIPGATDERIFTFYVHENRQKWLVLGSFTLGLFLIGTIAGRIFAAPGKEKPLQVGILLILCLASSGTLMDAVCAQENSNQKYTAELDVSPPTVGRIARIQWSLRPAGFGGNPSAHLNINITHLEKNQVVFAVEKVPVTGEFSFEYQFTDGSNHRVSAVAIREDGETVRQDQLVSVSAVVPPWRAQLPALALFLSVIFLGLLAGRWSRRE